MLLSRAPVWCLMIHNIEGWHWHWLSIRPINQDRRCLLVWSNSSRLVMRMIDLHWLAWYWVHLRMILSMWSLYWLSMRWYWPWSGLDKTWVGSWMAWYWLVLVHIRWTSGWIEWRQMVRHSRWDVVGVCHRWSRWTTSSACDYDRCVLIV